MTIDGTPKMPKDAALNLLRKHWADPQTTAVRLPIDPAAIAKAVGLTVKPFDSNPEGLSGALDADNKIIYFNADDSEMRQRFTVAHELGHFVLNHGSAFRDPRKNFNLDHYDIREVMANRFAAELLIPTPIIRSAIIKKGITDARVLCDKFGVSTTALRVRLRQANLL